MIFPKKPLDETANGAHRHYELECPAPALAHGKANDAPSPTNEDPQAIDANSQQCETAERQPTSAPAEEEESQPVHWRQHPSSRHRFSWQTDAH